MRWSNSKQNPFEHRSKPPAESMSGMHFAKSALQMGTNLAYKILNNNIVATSS